MGARDWQRFEDLSSSAVNLRRDAGRIHKMRNILAKLRRGFGIAKTYQLRHSLGAGGFGLTGVVDQYDRQGNHEKVLCVKFKLDSSSTLAHERRMTRVS